jgi:hypothetical protein
MPRNLFAPSTQPTRPAADRLLRFIQQAQLALVYSRRREGRLPLHDSFRLTLPARSGCATPGSSQSGAFEGNPLQQLSASMDQ